MAISRFKKGDKKPPTSGRKKGTPNKVNKNIKENFEAVFEELGGVEGFHEWANKNSRNQGMFYQMFSKMLPSNILGDIDAKVQLTVKREITDKSDDE